MIIRITGSIFLLAIADIGPAQTAGTENGSAATQYDAELARRLGADPYGMRSFVIAILKTGPNDATVTGEERQEIFKGHFANMSRLAGDGKLALAGPFGENDRAFRGLFFLAVETLEEARALAQTDPAVKAGVFVVEYLPWYGSAALMQVNDIHARIQEKAM